MRASGERPPNARRDWLVNIAAMLGLLLLGLLGDYFTGPEIPAAGFYMAAVVWASWRLGWPWGAGCAVGAALLNTITDEFSHVLPFPGVALRVNELLGFISLALVAGITGQARRHLLVQQAQRRELDAYYQRMEADLHTAQRLQRLLMGSVPETPGWEIGTFLRASRIVGGDVCRVTISPDGVTAVLVADVCGKGSSAALTGAMLLGLIDDAPDAFTSPAGTLKYLNDRLLGLLPDNLFVTAFYALADPETGRLLYSAAGHEPSLVFRGAAAEELAAAGPALGLLPRTGYPEADVSLAPGHLLLCYTDGVLDYRTPEGSRRDLPALRRIAAQYLESPCQKLVESVAEAITGGATDIPDDISLLALRRIRQQ